MDLNTDEIEKTEELSKTEEMFVQGICYVIFCLPLCAILKIKVYDHYMPIVKAFFKGVLA